ncbi:hypothetical protein [Plantactinospora sp. KBS50]|uniref:hypothetical protein n=1 Tax=Plantactinospora sp. KBS50 TaxID=2024580 RepID=UPI000BAA9E74|nr:hypothetical protein [Plantactinospora sp. KBS50]ASW53112.1 hypothetical protein CIK06_01280 [Plantactinospora sp. KBS50]
MKTVLSLVLPDMPRAAAIWIVLLLLGLAAMVALVVQPARSRRAEAADEPVPLDDEQQDLLRYADEVAVAADRAAATARQAREAWSAAQDEVESAWQAYRAAEKALEPVRAAAALPAPCTPQTPAEYADRERYLHRAVIAAHWRGELSVSRLTDALAHRAGWDPRLHPFDQERHLLQVIRDDLLAGHQAAAERERAAWQQAERSAEAARSLRAEAARATARATRPARGGDLMAELLATAAPEPTAGTPSGPVGAPSGPAGTSRPAAGRLRAARAG